MNKYIIKKTGEEIKIGDTVSIITNQNATFGVLRMKEVLKVTPSVLKRLIGADIVEVVESKDILDLTFYINMLAQKMGLTVEKTIELLNNMNKVCSRAVLDLLLKVIAQAFYNEDPKAFDEAEHYYSIRLHDGKCGEVHKVHSHIPLFKSIKDVETARKLLKNQLIYMYGEC